MWPVIIISMTNDETDITMALPWSMVSSSSDRRHGDMDDGDDDTDDENDDDIDHKNESCTAAGAALGASIILQDHARSR